METTTQTATASIIATVQGMEGIEPKKHFLQQFSKKYGEAAKSKGVSINALLVLAYAREGAVNLKTFAAWKQEGRRVKKGSKSLILWSHAISNGNTETETGTDPETGTKGKFFKIAFVFDEASTELI